jgi:hypothetical protein
MFKCVLEDQETKLVFVNDNHMELVNGKLYSKSIYTDTFPQFFQEADAVVKPIVSVDTINVEIKVEPKVEEISGVMLFDDSSDVTIESSEEFEEVETNDSVEPVEAKPRGRRKKSS